MSRDSTLIVRLNSQLVIHSNPEFLFATQVSLSCLYGHMPEQELDLIQFTACTMTQTCAGAPKIMRCERVLAFSSSFEILSLATASLTLALIVRERSSLRRFRRVIVEKCNLQRESVSGETSLISRRKGRYPDPMFRAEM